MHPTLFKIGNIAIPSWWVMFYTGFFIAAILCYRDYGDKRFLKLFLWLAIGASLGARIAYVAWHWDYYQAHFAESFNIFGGGLISFGGLLLAFLFGALFIRKNKMPFAESADRIFTYIPLVDAFRRIGCFLQGCCFGKPTNLPFGIVPPRAGFVAYHPTQVYFITSYLILYFLLRRISQRPHKLGTIVYAYFIYYFSARFIIEFSRVEFANRKGLLSIPQLICIIGLMIVLFLKFYRQKK